MTNKMALKVLQKYSTNVDLLNHCLAVSAGLKHFAKKFGEDENYWQEIGILHGLVYEMFYDKENLTCREIFKKENFTDEQIHSFMAHGYGSLTDIKPNCFMEYVFIAVDQLAEFIVSTPKLRDYKTVKRMLTNKDYKVGTQRFLKMCAKIDKDPDWVLKETLAAINKVKFFV